MTLEKEMAGNNQPFSFKTFLTINILSDSFLYMKYIFVTGGVVSGLGKGICAASLARLLIQRGYKVKNQKFDPYLNVDPGTMNPYQHGEVYVTEDGAETDLDLGHYERFTGNPLGKTNSITSGKIYWNVINRERNGGYLGRTVQIIPDVIDEIKRWIYISEEENYDIAICEIGGTVGDIESSPFLEAIRQVGIDKGKDNVIYIHVPLLVEIPGTGELKSKPVQRSVKELQSLGIQPDVLVCRSTQALDEEMINKIALMCNMDKRAIIPNLTAKSIYEVPLMLEEEGLCDIVVEKLKLSKNAPDLKQWKDLVNKIRNTHHSVKIAFVGKYTELHDSYLSIEEALFHAATSLDTKADILWIDSAKVNENSVKEMLKEANGIIIPGGFGNRGVEGMITAAKYARENDMPLLGICLGMQIMVIEYARSVLGYKDANSTEFNEETKHPVIAMMDEQKMIKTKGGTMRLGSYKCLLEQNSLARKLYEQDLICERHRHRYEFNITYKDQYIGNGMILCGQSPDHGLIEMVESANNSYYIGCQFHPEFKSNPLKPHPLFIGLISAILKKVNK